MSGRLSVGLIRCTGKYDNISFRIKTPSLSTVIIDKFSMDFLKISIIFVCVNFFHINFIVFLISTLFWIFLRYEIFVCEYFFFFFFFFF